MKKLYFLLIIILITNISVAQVFIDSTVNFGAKRILLDQRKGFSIGSYGEAHYNAPIEKGKFRNGTADLHRVILYMGYRFNSKLQFFTEIEVEHVNQIAIEQAFINYKFNSLINLKAGVILIPMGYVNEFHEPTLFNGVERPAVDKYIIPTTWSELGVGFHGLVKKASIKYQIFAVNGFKGYDGTAKFTGSTGIRGGRQKASNAIVRTPSFTGKVVYYGIKGLKLGVSGYYGKTESTLYNGINRDNLVAVAEADSSSVGIAMASFNIDYQWKNIGFRGEGILSSLSNTDQYNEFTGMDLGKEIMGYYGEVYYSISLKKGYPKFIPFVRYENYNTHFKVSNNTARQTKYNREVLTSGLGFQLTPGTIFKADFQWLKTEAQLRPTNMFNIGFGFWF